MPIFRYKGYKQDGSPASGTLEADGLQDAVSSVKELGVYPRDVSELIQKEGGWFRGKFDRTLLPHITRQLSILLASGVPLLEALKSLSEENRGGWRSVLVGVRDAVSGGASLARALEAYGDVFPGFYVNMVTAGEQSGSLDKVLVLIADFLEKQATIRARVRAAMVYPLFMSFVGIVVMSFLFTFVVPKIVMIFENSRSALPLITIVLIKISRLFINYWWALIIAAAALVLGARRLKAKHRRLIDSLTLRLPGGVVQSLYYGRFAGTLGFLLAGGLPMLKSLELSARSVGNTVIEERVMAAAKKVAEGARISASLEGFPSVLLQLISTGEKSGALHEILGKAAVSYEEEFERKVRKALSLLEPVMILVMGVAVGFIVLAVLLPMFQLNQLVK